MTNNLNDLSVKPLATQDLILVLDLEATCCDQGSIPENEMEILEIGACWAKADGAIVDRYQSFVRPKLKPSMTKFCRDLLGIEQAAIDSARPFPAVSEELQAFALLHQESAMFWGSWGAYDRKQIERECARHNVPSPLSLPHQNLKRSFAKVQRIGKEVGMAKACELAKLALQGSHHRALDDAINIARLLPWSLGSRALAGKRPLSDMSKEDYHGPSS